MARLLGQVQKGINAVVFPKKLKGDVEALVQSSAAFSTSVWKSGRLVIYLSRHLWP